MRARFPVAKMSRLSLLPVVALMLASCGGDGSVFYAEPGAPSVDAGDNNAISTVFTEYTAGEIEGYPLPQMPATDAATLTWLVAEINGDQSPPDLKERIQTTTDLFNRYATRQSRGAFEFADNRVSPPLQIDVADESLLSLTELQQQIQVTADAAGFQYDDKYVAYLIVRDGVETIASGTGDGETGTLTVTADFTPTKTVHEMLHMLSIGNADAMEGGNAVFPGENVRDGDPYSFQGNEASTEDCLNGSSPCEIAAPLSIPHKGMVGWLDSSEVVVSDNTGTEKVFRLFNHDNIERSETQPLTVYLTGYDANGLFAVSYLAPAQLETLSSVQSSRVTSTGITVHYVPYDSPADSHLIDLTPDSITSNDEQSNDPAPTALHDFGDAAISAGALADVGGLFSIEVIDTGESGTGESSEREYWADIKIKPSSCIYPAREFATDDFLDQQTTPAEGYCETSYSFNWGVKAARIGEVSTTDISLQYPDLNLTGSSLTLSVDESRADSLGLSRPLSASYTDGDTIWISYLLQPQQLGDGHMLVYPGSTVDAGIGKQWGDQFGIGNEAALNGEYPVANEVTWLVGKYELLEGADTITLWINPDATAEPAASTAYAVRSDIDVGDISSLSINLNHTGSGVYNIDRVYTGAQFSDIGNVLAPAIPAPMIALHYDVAPDLDDLHAIAAGANLSDKFGVEPAVVIGSYGIAGEFAHGGNPPETLYDLYHSATNMLGQGANDGETRRQKGRQVADAAYGPGGYLDTGDGWETAVNTQAEKFWASLQSGQEVLVADGGPMDFTADVLTRLQSHHGATDAELKRVSVIQHSLGFNVVNTLPANLQKIQDLATYITIDNGNVGGNATANLEDSESNTTTSDFAQWARNNNSHSDAWNSALDDFSAKIDFSDTVEYLYILDIPLDLVSDIGTFSELFE